MSDQTKKIGVYLTEEQLKDLSSLLHMVTGMIQTSGLVQNDRTVIDEIDGEYNKWNAIAGEVSSHLGQPFMGKRLRHFTIEPDPVPGEKKEGHLVKPETYPVVVFEWMGEGQTPQQIALDAFNNIQQADSRPVCTVVMPTGEQHTVDLEHVNDVSLGIEDDEDGL